MQLLKILNRGLRCGLAAAALLPMLLCGSDTEADSVFMQAVALEKEKNWVDAAELFQSAEILADSPYKKASAAERVAMAYREAGWYGKEYDALEHCLAGYPGSSNTKAVVERLYAIGDIYYEGYRDPAYWSLRWIPWLRGKSRAIEIYEKALQRAPYAPAGAMARLRLAVNYLEKPDYPKALKLLREVLDLYPDTEAYRYALLELGNALFCLAGKGDGDGQYYDDAMAVFRTFQEKYPEGTENEWVKCRILEAKDIYAERLYNIAKFYHRYDHDDSAEQYLLEVLRRFPESTSAAESEEMLTKLDRTYFPEQIETEAVARIPDYETFSFPQETNKILIAPENSGNKYLLPIRELNLPKRTEEKP